MQAARARGIEVLGELELAWRLLGNEFLAVTGTNGKTTTVAPDRPHLPRGGVALRARRQRRHGGQRARRLARARRDRHLRGLLVSARGCHRARTGDRRAAQRDPRPPRPPRDDGQRYLAAKLSIFARQDEADHGRAARRPRAGRCAAGRRHAVRRSPARLAGSRSAPARAPSSRWSAGQLAWRGSELLGASELRLRGRAQPRERDGRRGGLPRARDSRPRPSAAGLRSFAGVPHRLEEVGLRDGVLYVNDSKATNVASTLVALTPSPRPRPRRVHLILGGQGKQQDFSSLREPCRRASAAPPT